MKSIFNFKFSILNSKKGFTMVELLIYMGLLTILLTVLTSIFASALEVQLESQATSSVEQDGRYIIARLAYDIRRAQTIVVPATQGAQGNSLKLTLSGVSSTYSIDGNGNLQLVNNVGTNLLNGYDTQISGFTVGRYGNTGKVEDTIQLSFIVTSRTQKVSGTETKIFQTTIAKRRQ